MTICYYISGHGYGHAARSTEVIRRFSAEIPVIIKTEVPTAIFDAELSRPPAQFIKAGYDCGVIQTDAFNMEAEATRETYSRLMDQNGQRLSDEAEFLRANDVKVVVSDIVPFACRAAREAAIPSIVIANFTWLEIYASLADNQGDWQPLIDSIRNDYSLADLALIVPPHTQIDAFPRCEAAPMIARFGENRREEIDRELGLDPGKKLFILYVGAQMLTDVDWRRLEAFDDINFLCFSLPEYPVRNLVDPVQGRWRHPDLSASCDAIIGKTGYGICGECMASNTPLIYAPREDFEEYFALHQAMQEWGGGICVPTEDFYEFRWQPYLDKLDNLKLTPLYALDGAEHCVRRIMEFYNKS